MTAAKPAIQPAIQIDDLSQSFGGPFVLSDVAFALERGRVHSIIGPNGAGKTTLMNLISGLYQPTRGRVLIDGQDIAGRPAHDLVRLGLARTFQNLKVSFAMTVQENVLLGRHHLMDGSFLRGLFRGPKMIAADRAALALCRDFLALVGIDPDEARMPGALSYGTLKRLEIARALAADPRILLLDEPAAGLNPQETLEIKELIRGLAERDMTVVLVEHDMKLVMDVSHNIVVMNYGRKIAEGTPEQVARNPDVITAYLGTGAHQAAQSAQAVKAA